MTSDNDPHSQPLNRVIAEYLQAVEAGEPPSWGELLARYPDLADQLQEFFEQHDSVQSAATGAPYSPGEDVTVAPAEQLRAEATVAPDASATLQIGTKVRYFGDYELLEEIARGGMGVVYKARQVSLNRIVALKMILAGQLASEEDVKRFHAEAEAAANLDHPGIVPIYEVGVHDGQHYFSMGYVEGESLAAKVADGPLPPREAAQCVRALAEAVQYAHDRGVIHRDLKPANILMEENMNSDVEHPGRESAHGSSTSGRSRMLTLAAHPRITDFGLAKRIVGDSHLTSTGQILGTPSYMPPEQAAGKLEEIGPASDVYSLGAILYCLLTSRPPFQSANPMDTLLQVLEREPVPLRQLNSKAPRDLETICAKCLQKLPHRRYVSALALEDDLRCYLADEPIAARPISPVERAAKWIKRRPAAAGLIGVSAAAVFLLMIGGFWYNSRLAGTLQKVTEQEGIAKKERNEAQRQATRAAQREQTARQYLYAAHMNIAMRAYDEGNVPLVRRLLDVHQPRANQDDLRSFDWYYLRRLCEGENVKVLRHADTVWSVVFSPDGDTLASASSDGTVKLWDSVTGQLKTTLPTPGAIPMAVDFSPDGSTLAAACSNGALKLWHSPTGESTAANQWREGMILGPKIRLGGTNVSSEILGAMLEKRRAIRLALEFSHGGNTLAAVGEQNTLRLWDMSSGDKWLTLQGHRSPVRCVGFAPDDRTLATGAGEYFSDGEIRLWDSATGRQITALEGHQGVVYNVIFSPDGETLVTSASDTTIRLWDVATGQEKALLTGHSHEVQALALSPDGALLASAGTDLAVRLWDMSTQQQLTTFGGHERGVRSLAFAPDGRALASASADNTVRLYDLSNESGPVILKHENEVRTVAFSPSGATVVTAGFEPTIRLWDTSTGRQLGALSGFTPGITSLSFLPGGKTLMIDENHEGRGRVTLCDLSTRHRHTIVQSREGCTAASPSPDGALLAVGTGFWQTLAPGVVNLYHIPSGQLRATLSGHSRNIESVDFSQDGRLLATASRDRSVKLWDVATGAEVSTLEGHEDRVNLALFSPDGRTLATASWDRSTKLWDVATGDELFTLAGHLAGIYGLAFSPDGRTVATGCWDGTVKFWDPTTGQERATLQAHDRSIWYVEFSPDGRTLATASRDGTAKLWRAATDEAIPAHRIQVSLDLAYASAAGEAWDQAITHYTEAISAGADDPDVWSDRGYAHVMLEQWDQAVADLSRAIEPYQTINPRDEAIDLAPEHARVLSNRARAYAGLGDLDKAITDFNEAIRIDPASARAYGDRGKAYARKGELDHAISDYNETIRLNPADAMAHLHRFDLVLAKGAPPQTALSLVEEAERALDEVETLEILFLHAAWSLWSNGQSEYDGICRAAAGRFSQSTDSRALYLLARLHALAIEPSLDTGELVGIAERAVAARPVPWRQHALGLCLLRDGQIDAAIDEFTHSLAQVWEAEPVNWLGLAIAHSARGRDHEEQKWLDKTLHWLKENPLDLTSELHPHDRLACQLLLREATERISREQDGSVNIYPLSKHSR